MSFLQILTFILGFTLIRCQNFWHSYQFGTGCGNREEISITNVSVIENFLSGANVSLWKSVEIGGESWGAGLMMDQGGVTLVNFRLDEGELDVKTRFIDFGRNVTSLDLIHFWNENSKQEDPVLITLTDNSKLTWYFINNFDIIIQSWSWIFQVEIRQFHYTKIGDKNNLLIISGEKVLIYEFDGPKLWLTQVLPFTSLPESLAITEFGPDIYLTIAFPHQNLVQIHKLEGGTFLNKQNLTSVGVTQILPFKIGFNAFLAVNGYHPGLYKFTKKGVVLEELNLFLDGIEFWFILPVKSYRDEVILIGQRLLHHGPHKSLLVEGFVHDGQNFVRHEEIPCLRYGSEEVGLTCMIDEEEESGLKGSTVVKVGQKLLVLVPSKTQHSSHLFHIQTMLKPVKSPAEIQVEKLVDFKEHLEKTLLAQQNKVKTYETTFKKAPESAAKIVEDNLLGQSNDWDSFKQDLNDIAKTIENLGKKLEEVSFGGEVTFEGSAQFGQIFAETLNGEDPNILHDFVRANDLGHVIKGRKTFTNLKVNHLQFDGLNNFLDKTSSPLVINGNITFENDVQIVEDVFAQNLAGFDNLENELVQMGRKFDGQLTFESVLDVVDSVTIEGNLTVTQINGEDFDKLKESLCFTNIENHIPGEIFFKSGVVNFTETEVDFLNGLRFPEEYVFRGFESLQIAGVKNFTNFTTQQLTITNTINDADPNSIITLKNDQNLHGNYTFSNLEVTESFEVEGNVVGPKLDQFLENPMLTETNEIKARVSFKSLEVDGIVFVGGDFNGKDFSEVLEDVVYVDDGPPLITALKNFSHGISVTNGIQVASNSINWFPLENFVTTNTEQTLNVQTWNSKVDFQNLQILGLFDGINITELDETTVKLTGEQFVNSTLNFENFWDIVDVTADQFVITENLNELSDRNFLFTEGASRNFVVDNMNFEEWISGDVLVDGDVFASLSGFSLEDFDARRVSCSRNQSFTAKYAVDNLESGKMEVRLVNGFEHEKLFGVDYFSGVISRNLFDGKIKIANLHVNDSLEALSLNNLNLDSLQDTFWTNKNNHFKSATFAGPVFIKSLNITNFNSVNFAEFSYNIVKKHEKNLTLNGHKTFANGFHVVKSIDSDRLNHILIDSILTKTGPQTVRSELKIYGNVEIGEGEIGENLNGVEVDYLKRTFEFHEDFWVINEDVVFNRLPYINHLLIENYAENNHLDQFLNGIIYPDQNLQIPGTTIFDNLVHIKGDVSIDNAINKVDLSEFVEEMVDVSKGQEVDVSLIFLEPVEIQSRLGVSTNLEAPFLRGINLENWMGAAFINEGIIPGTVTFESLELFGEVFLNFVNDIELAGLIPLGSEQAILADLHLDKMKTFNDVTVGNYVNGQVLEDLQETSVYGNFFSQTITSPITFTGNVLIRNNFNVQGLVSGKNFSKIVSTITDHQILSPNLVFKDRIILENNLFLRKNTLNRINLTNWQNSLVRLESNTQEIYNKWVVEGNVTFKENVDGDGLVGGLDLKKLAKDVEEKRFYKSITERNLVETYTNTCLEVNKLIDVSKRQIYTFKYFEKMGTLSFENSVWATHSFSFLDKSYLLVSQISSCTTTLMVWEQNTYITLDVINMGMIDQFVTVETETGLFLITNSAVNACEIWGTNVWSFEVETLTHFLKLEDHVLLQDSLKLGTFYGLLPGELIEYRLETITQTIVKKYRKWPCEIPTGQIRFAPRGVGVGLALYNSTVLAKFLWDNRGLKDETYGYETNEIVVGKVVYLPNTFLPDDGNLVVINVGEPRRSLLAVASCEDTVVKGKPDFIKILEEPLTARKIFHKIPAYKPSSMLTLEFGQSSGEALLLYLENNRNLQVYKYKGIEGFVPVIEDVKLPGSRLFLIELKGTDGLEGEKLVGVVNGREIGFLWGKFEGSRLAAEKIDCDL